MPNHSAKPAEMVGPGGNDPPSQALQASANPSQLWTHIIVNLVELLGNDPSLEDCKSSVRPIRQPLVCVLASVEGVEPSSTTFVGSCSIPVKLHGHINL